MSARHHYCHLADSKEGRAREQEVAGKILADVETHGAIDAHFAIAQVVHQNERDVGLGGWCHRHSISLQGPATRP